VAAWDYLHSGNHADIGVALAAIREAAGDAFLVGEVYLPTRSLGPYLECFDLVFAFEFLHAPPRAEALGAAIREAVALERVAWVLSNHDFPRVASRWGPRLAPVAAALLLFLPGAAFVYQGEELGLQDGPPGNRRFDRYGRDGARNPIRWDDGPGGGFSAAEPWLPLAESPSAAAQSADPGSTLSLYRRLISMRRRLAGAVRVVEARGELLLLGRGDFLLAANLGGTPARIPDSARGRTLLETEAGALRGGELAPSSAAVIGS
jgi:alpha-glucosidase